MNKTATINTRIEPELKAKAEAILQSIGLRHSDAISMFYRQVVLHDGLPFNAKIPNAETLKALKEVVDGKTNVYDSIDELIADLNK